MPAKPSDLPAEPASAFADPLPPPALADVALDDWCAERSRALGRRVEALSAFAKRCRRSGLGRATPAQYEADFQSFLASPA